MEDGNVMAWGNNSNYQLGHTDGSVNENPRRVEFFRDITIEDIAAGGWFSLAVDYTGSLMFRKVTGIIRILFPMTA